MDINWICQNVDKSGYIGYFDVDIYGYLTLIPLLQLPASTVGGLGELSDIHTRYWKLTSPVGCQCHQSVCHFLVSNGQL